MAQRALWLLIAAYPDLPYEVLEQTAYRSA